MATDPPIQWHATAPVGIAVHRPDKGPERVTAYAREADGSITPLRTHTLWLGNETLRLEFVDEIMVGRPDQQALEELLDTAAHVGRGSNATAPALVIRRAADIQERKATYLWRPWLPHASYIDLGGDPGAGKTFLAVELAACASRGEWPGQAPASATSVVFLATEDSIEMVLKARLRTAGADMDRITFIEGAATADGAVDDLLLERDYGNVLAHIREREAGLVYIDALVDVLPEHDGKGYAESRQATKLIPRLARDSGAALLATRHMKKAGEGPAWKQSVGSVAYASRARVMLQVYPDRDEEGRRILTCCKHNTAAYPPSLAFRLEGGDEDTPPHVGWLGEDHRTANQLAAEAAKSEREAPAIERAQEWLAGRLSAGPADPATLVSEGAAAGLSRATIHRAADAIGVVKHPAPPAGFGKGRRSTWELPHTSQANHPARETTGNDNELALSSPHTRVETNVSRLDTTACPTCGNTGAIRDGEHVCCPRCHPVAFDAAARSAA